MLIVKIIAYTHEQMERERERERERFLRPWALVQRAYFPLEKESSHGEFMDSKLIRCV